MANLLSLPEYPPCTPIAPAWSWPMTISLLGRMWELVRTEPAYRRRMQRHLYAVPDRSSWWMT